MSHLQIGQIDRWDRPICQCPVYKRDRPICKRAAPFANGTDWPVPFANWTDWQIGRNIYNRLPFGVSVAPAIFPPTMDLLVAGFPSVVVHLDDIMVSGQTRAEPNSNLRAVLERLQSAGLKLNRAMCHVVILILFGLSPQTDAGLVTGHPMPEIQQQITQSVYRQEES